MFPDLSDGVCGRIVRSERRLSREIHMPWKGVWSAFPTSSTETPPDSVRSGVPTVDELLVLLGVL